MNKIKLLSPDQIKKIAAGEVVDRPVNIVKELVENALDAEANHITLHLEDGGKNLIRVVDNGVGMSEEDALLCFKHHTTSKLDTIEDLEKLASFGFRGEALSSIASVSSVTLITKTKDAPYGTRITFEGTTLRSQSATSAVQGTDIQIANLFNSLPARKKFLKKRETEWRQIQLLMHAFCLSNLSIYFKVIHDKKLLFTCPPTQSLKERVQQLQLHRVAQNLIPIHAQKDEMALVGYCTNHTFYNYDRSGLFCFVNGRWIKNPALSKAILKGYQNVLPSGRFPAGYFSLSIPPEQVDINVHPKKEEVLFLHPRRVDALVSSAIKTSLDQALTHQLQQVTPATRIHHFSTPVTFGPISPFPSGASHIPSQPSTPELTPHQASIISEEDTSIIGQYNRTYIIVIQDNGLLFVDQHAAQERILYERFEKYFNNTPTIPLLFPQSIQFSSDELQRIEPHLNLFKHYGVIMELFGKDQIIVTSTPSYLKHVQWKDCLYDVITWINEATNTLDTKLRAQMACKAAVKAGDVLTNQQMRQLVTDLSQTNNRVSCPHGRPTSWLLGLNDLEKKFKRRS